MRQAVLRWGYDRVWDRWPVMLIPLVRKFRQRNGYWPSLLHPRTLNEKTLHRLLFDRRPFLKTFAGKVESRPFVRARLGEQALVPWHGIIRHPDDLRTIRFPDRFILKGSHGSGMLHVHAGGPLDLAPLEPLCREWLAHDTAKYAREWIYKTADRAVVVESLLADAAGNPPIDYKIFCYDGVPGIVDVHTNRFTDHRRDLFQPDWTPIPGCFRYPNSDTLPSRPPHLDQMMQAAATLSRDVDFVRVDLYDTDRVYFGELTTTPDAAIMEFDSHARDLAFGASWSLATSGGPRP